MQPFDRSGRFWTFTVQNRPEMPFSLQCAYEIDKLRPRKEPDFYAGQKHCGISALFSGYDYPESALGFIVSLDPAARGIRPDRPGSIPGNDENAMPASSLSMVFLSGRFDSHLKQTKSMKKIKLLIAGLIFLAGLASTAFSATNGVVNGQDFQSVIDASAPGDTLVVQPGVYPDASLNFNKPLTVLPSGTNGDTIQFIGTVQVTGAGASSFQRAYFATNVQTTGSTVSFFDSYFNGPVTANGGKVTMKRTFLNSALALTNNAALEALRMTNNSTITAMATVGSGTPFLAVQSSFSNIVIISGYNVWLGYNYFNPPVPDISNLIETNCSSVLLGNQFIANAYAVWTIPVSEFGGNLKAYNNLISGNMSGGWRGPWYGMYLNSTVAEIVNNTIRLGNAYKSNGYRGIQANGGGPVTLRGNIISLNVYGGYDCGFNFISVEGTGGASLAVFPSYSSLFAAVTTCPGDNVAAIAGVTPPPVNCLLQIDPNLASDGSLNPGSPCIHAGPPDAIYNNRDGTRNTMGYTGGPYWNPANYTNNNPMVFLLTGQQIVTSGAQTNIQVNVGASAGH